MKKYIITGGPYAGKTSVINLLERNGIPVLHETARMIILEDQARKEKDPSYNMIYPWEDQKIFCRRCHERQLERERLLTCDLAVLDRSAIDNLAYAAVAGIELDKKIFTDIKKAGYEKKVFYFELLDNYEKDNQRKDSEDQVKSVHRELYYIYTKLGFKLITVPLFSKDKNTSIKKRGDFIFRSLGFYKQSLPAK